LHKWKQIETTIRETMTMTHDHDSNTEPNWTRRLRRTCNLRCGTWSWSAIGVLPTFIHGQAAIDPKAPDVAAVRIRKHRDAEMEMEDGDGVRERVGDADGVEMETVTGGTDCRVRVWNG